MNDSTVQGPTGAKGRAREQRRTFSRPFRGRYACSPCSSWVAERSLLFLGPPLRVSLDDMPGEPIQPTRRLAIASHAQGLLRMHLPSTPRAHGATCAPFLVLLRHKALSRTVNGYQGQHVNAIDRVVLVLMKRARVRAAYLGESFLTMPMFLCWQQRAGDRASDLELHLLLSQCVCCGGG